MVRTLCPQSLDRQCLSARITLCFGLPSLVPPSHSMEILLSPDVHAPAQVPPMALYHLQYNTGTGNTVLTVKLSTLLISRSQGFIGVFIGIDGLLGKCRLLML